MYTKKSRLLKVWTRLLGSVVEPKLFIPIPVPVPDPKLDPDPDHMKHSLSNKNVVQNIAFLR